MKKKKFEVGVSLNILLVLVLSSVVLMSGIGSSVNTPSVALEDKSITFDNLLQCLVPRPIFGTAEYDGDGWAVGASVEVVSSEGTLTDTVGSSGEWQVDCGDPGPNWPEGTDFTVLIYGIDSYTGWRGIAYGTVSGYYNDMGDMVVYPPGDLDCDGSLSWTDVSPGATVTSSFTVSNVGISGSLLDWEIASEPDWGTWTFDPEEDLYLTPGASPFIVDVEVVAPNEKNAEFEGEITIVNKENSSDTCAIQVSLATPMNQQPSSSQVLQFLQKLRQRFPLFQ